MREDVLTGRTALLLAAFAAAALASVTGEAVALALVVLALLLGGAAACRPLVVRLGRALKPPPRRPGKPH